MTANARTIDTQYARINDATVAYRTLGTGTPIILANRFRGTLDTWDPYFLDLLAERHTVIIYDYTGVGYSNGELPLDIHHVAAGIKQLADHLHLDTFIVGGWSYGGLVAQYATFLNPARVLGTLVIGSNPMGRNEIQLSPLFLERALKPMYDAEDMVTLMFEPASAKSVAAAQASGARIEARLDRSKIPSTPELFQRYFAPTLQVAEDADRFREAYQTLQTPVLVISGDHDISFAAENWFPLMRNAPTLHHIIMPDSGHAPHFQYPELTTAYIASFVAQFIA